MSLLQKMSFSEYKKVIDFLSIGQCEVVAKLANLDIHFDESKKPGEKLLKCLDSRGCTMSKYREYINKALCTKLIRTYYRPETKIAILIANENYQHLSKLVTPSIDCDALASSFKNLGFMVVTIKNTTSKDLKEILAKVFELIPENSYCFVFYAGHGCELCNTRCMLGIECPAEDIQLSHCVTENYVLREANKCKPDMSVLIMDMCGLCLNRSSNPQIFRGIPDIEEFNIHKNCLIAYSTQSMEAAYEVLQLECSHTIDSGVTYELQPGDTGRIVPRGSQYVTALYTRLEDGLEVSDLLDKVHEDVVSLMKKQIPIKVQYGVAKRSLYDPARGDTEEVLSKIKEICKAFEDYCTVF